MLHTCVIASVVSDSLRPYGPWPARLLCPRDSPGKNIGASFLSLLGIPSCSPQPGAF